MPKVVEFEDASFAIRALFELYGEELCNSSNLKGGIRLSFSSLGVRSGEPHGMHDSKNREATRMA